MKLYAVEIPDQRSILSKVSLQLIPKLQEGRARGRFLTLKNPGGKRSYLVVDREQATALRQWDNSPRTVPEALFSLIQDRKSPPLRDFYELVLKAVEAGFLIEKGSTPAEPEPAINWKVRIGPRWVFWPGLIALIIGTVEALLPGITLPETWGFLFLGYLAAVILVNLGNLLAASVVAGSGGEIPGAEFRWLSPAPHWRPDLRDAAMGGSGTEAAVAIAKVAPLSIAIAAAKMWYPEIALPLILGWFVLIAPVVGGPAARFIRATFGSAIPDVGRDPLFVMNKVLWVIVNRRLHWVETKHVAALGAYTLIWSAALFWVGTNLFDRNAVELVAEFYRQGHLLTLSIVLLVIIATIVLGSAAFGLWMLFSNIGSLFEGRFGKPAGRKPAEGPPTDDSIRMLLKETLLFRDLENEDIDQIVTAIRPLEFARKSFVLRENEEGDALYVVYSGSVEILKELTDGPQKRVAVLGPGDAFGEIALLRKVPRTRSVRALEKTVLLSLQNEDFQSVVVSRLGAKRIEETLQKIAFLSRINLCRNWTPDQLAAFARTSTIKDYAAGAVVIEEGTENTFFHIVYEGQFEVRSGKKVRERLGFGDYFGEISLLQKSPAAASVVATEDSRCLVVSQNDFLRFISEDFTVGLQFEQISSKRLGKPVFPLR